MKTTAQREMDAYLERTKEQRKARFARQAEILRKVGLGNTQEANALRKAAR